MSDDDSRVQLTRIEGKLDVTNERLNNVQNDIADIRRTQNTHGDRLGILEADKNRRDGRGQGVSMTGKLVWSIASFLVGSGGVVAVVELMK